MIVKRVFLKNYRLSNNKTVNTIINHYAKTDNWHNINKNSANLGYGWLHYSIIRNTYPKNLLCIGSKYGYIPSIMAQACKENGVGTVDFVDAGYDQESPEDNHLYKSSKLNKSRHWGGVGFWKKNNSHKHFQTLNLNKNINTHITKSNNFFKQNKKTKWQYIYLDGDHSYQGIKNDFQNSIKHLDDHGYILIHDIFTESSKDLSYGVNKYWKEIKKKNKYNLIEIPGKCGLGVIQI